MVSHRKALDRPHDVELQGRLAFVAGKGGSLAILDVSQPEEPRILWHRHDAAELHDAETVLPGGDRLFLGTDDFVSLDIRAPQRPVVEKTLSRRPTISKINGMVRRGDTILAASKNGFLDAFDVSDPAATELAGAVNIRRQYDLGWPHDVDLFREFAVVPDPRRFGRVKEAGKLALIEVFDRRKPERLLPPEQWKLAGLVATEQLVGANRVQVSDSFAYVGASTGEDGGRLIVVDLREPEQPRQVAWLPFAPQDGYGPNGLTVAGEVVFLAGGQTVEAIDVRTPEEPVRVARQSFAEQLPGGKDSGHDLVYRDGHLYVTGQNDHCLLILRVASEKIRALAR